MHVNKIPFRGVLTQVNVSSDTPPSGARGHQVILTKSAVIECMHTLIGMAIDYKIGWDGHNERQKCGIINKVYIQGIDVKVEGYLYNRDFPEIKIFIDSLRDNENEELGMSYELASAHVLDINKTIWTIHKATFTGAAILLKHKAAYKNTSFQLIES